MATITRPLPGAPVVAERPRWTSYLRWSVDHKVIGIQYMVMAFFFFLIGGTLAMLFRAELLTPQLGRGADRAAVQPVVHDPRHGHDLPVHHPVFRRAGQLLSSR